MKLAFGVLLAAILLSVLTFPARSIEIEMRADTEQAKAEGFPQLPPGYATPKQLDNYSQKWFVGGTGYPLRKDLEDLSIRVGVYDVDSSLYGLGIMAGLIAVVFMSAVAYSRSMQNLYALGFETPGVSSAWVFASWFIPVLGWVLPWWIISVILGRYWSRGSDEEPARPTILAWILSGIWGLTNLGLWILNPLTVTWFFSTGDIDRWLTRFAWTERMLIWLPVPVLVTAVVLLVITFEQRRRYRARERVAA
jgi:hypothetical protein